MFGSLRSLMLAALIAPGLTFAASIDDGAKMFSKEAIEKAERKIDQIRRESGRDVVIETFAEAKDMDRAKDEKTKAGYFGNWARTHYEDRRIEGVYVLICKTPPRVQPAVGKLTEKQGFDREHRADLTTSFTKHLGKGQFDEGLLAGVDYIGDTLSRLKKTSEAPRAAPGGSADPDGGMTWVGWVVTLLVVLLVAWLVVGLIRAFSGAGGGYGGPGYGGGGGFFSSFMGGLFGAAAGMWMYNTFFNPGYHHDHSSAGYDPSGGVTDQTATSDEGGGWSGSDNADGGGGGGDWGGGDEGGAGGDWGGDAGGGGDWGGGGDVGGGDW